MARAAIGETFVLGATYVIEAGIPFKHISFIYGSVGCWSAKKWPHERASAGQLVDCVEKISRIIAAGDGARVAGGNRTGERACFEKATSIQLDSLLHIIDFLPKIKCLIEACA